MGERSAGGSQQRQRHGAGNKHNLIHAVGNSESSSSYVIVIYRQIVHLEAFYIQYKKKIIVY